MPVLGLLFLRYAYSRYKMVEEKILKDRPVRNGRKMPVEASDFTAKSTLFLPEMAQFDYLVNLPENVASMGLVNVSGQTIGSLGKVVNNAMELYLDGGWQFSFRIHNASTKVESSLKFDIQIIGMPTTIISIDCRWK